MAVNKIIYNGETLVDLTSDTVTADDLAAGVTATGADGKPVIGLLPKVTIDTELSTTSTNPVQNKTITAALSNLDIDIATNDEIDNALNLAGSGDLPTGGGGIVPHYAGRYWRNNNSWGTYKFGRKCYNGLCKSCVQWKL